MTKQDKKSKQPTVVIRRVTVEQWDGIAEAARLLGRTTTHVRRHVNGEVPSEILQKRMDKLGIVIER